jgi:hypothetical protein
MLTSIEIATMKFISRTFSIILASFVLTGPTHAAEKFTVTQSAPMIEHIDLGAQGASHGELLAFEAPFTTADGKEGVMSGIIITVALPDGPGGVFFDRIGNIVMDFGGIDSLVIAGKSLYGTGEGEMNPNMPQVRAVTGGTGRYIGSRGQVTTTRQATGDYLHTIELVD